MQSLRRVLVGLSFCGMLFRAPLALGEDFVVDESRAMAQPKPAPSLDIRLDRQGRLLGQLLDPAGIPIADADVVLMRSGNKGANRVRTDRSGRFAFEQVGTGTGELTAANSTRSLRLWGHDTAPPLSLPEVLMISGEDEILRGQRPLGTLFGCQPVMLGVLLAAAIAIPLAIHDAGDRPAASN